MDDNAKRQQVADQCKVVAHLASVMAKVHADYEMMIRDGRLKSTLDIVGRRTSHFMEVLGDALNGMDAVTEEDDWTHPVFEKREAFGFGAGEDA